MSCSFLRYGLLAWTLILASCGSASVKYSQAQSSSETNIAAIEQAAADGGLHVTLPITRLVILVPKTAVIPAPARNLAHDPAAPIPAAAEGHAPVTPAVGVGTTNSPTQAAGPKQTAVADLSTQIINSDGTFTITALQTEGAFEFDVKGVNNFFSKNDFGIAYVANTRIPSTVSNSFTNETAARVKSITSIAGALLPLIGAEAENEAGPETTCDASPIIIDLVAGQHTWKSAASNDAQPCYTVAVTRSDVENKDPNGDFSPIEKDLVSIPVLLRQINVNSSRIARVWPVPACLKVRVVIKSLSGKPAQGDVTVIDPDYVSLMPIPDKEKIAMHPICGADFADTADDRWGDILDAAQAVAATIPKSSKK